jgi:hypothetical protein
MNVERWTIIDADGDRHDPDYSLKDIDIRNAQQAAVSWSRRTQHKLPFDPDTLLGLDIVVTFAEAGERSTIGGIIQGHSPQYASHEYEIQLTRR